MGNFIKANPFLDLAKDGHNEFWRYLLTIGLMIAASFWVSLVASLAAILFNGTDLNQYPPLVMLLLGTSPFPFTLMALWFGVRFLHKRPFRSLVTPFKQVRWKQLFISALLWFLLAGISDLVLSFLQPGNYHWSLDFSRFIPYLLVTLVVIPIQTSTEEFIFRAYLPQGIARFTPGFWLPWIIPAVVFGLLHSLNPEVDTYGFLLTIPFYIGFGLVLGWITLRSRSLELALGLHLANNLYASLIVTFPGSALPSPALFTIQSYDAALSLVVWAVMSIIYLLVLFLAFPRWFSPPESLPVEQEMISQ
ncbi:MAG TPA: type II CAAX endopeptidase family protein [Anaerolineaceae bacterium]|nr:type II CAAX endopeptidase family protein [Anaerolineaceae bacterium]